MAGDRRASGAAHPAAERPTVAALTMVRNEHAMLPRWVRHYAAQCGGADHLLVIDDNSDDGSTDDLPCPVVRIPPLTKGHFEPTRLALLSKFAAGLLEAYDAVVFTDADEFLVAEPRKYPTLVDLVADRPDDPVLGAMGLNLVHHVGEEPPLDPGRPLLSQRRLAKFVPLMCKPAVKRVPAAWTAASHGVKGTPYRVDPELFMFHAKFSDRDALRAAADHRREMVELDGRAHRTNWKYGGDAMVDLLDTLVADVRLEDVKPFTPPRRLLANIVREEGQTFRARGDRQVPAMRKRPFVRVPDRFHGLV